MNLPHSLDRSIVIHAPRDVVFAFFTDSARWADWWGAGSTIDPKVGGRVFIRMPGNVDVVGEVLAITPSSALVFTYGFASGQPIPAGGSRVTITLDDIGDGTRLRLRHEFAEAQVRDEHVQGWRYQLALFSNAVLNQLHAGVESRVDAWFATWAESSAGTRRAALAALASEVVAFRDRYSATDGLDDLSAHIAAAQRFMPGVKLERRGAVRHCQGTVIADWTAAGPDGKPLGSGSNVFLLGGDGRFTAVTGLWG
jgi:uncharacterized protein YndB with AHSA1/START domain